MSTENKEVIPDSSENEQITKPGSTTKTSIKTAGQKTKDPKKVAAGKKLAEQNRKAKEALNRELKREAEAEGGDSSS